MICAPRPLELSRLDAALRCRLLGFSTYIRSAVVQLSLFAFCFWMFGRVKEDEKLPSVWHRSVNAVDSISHELICFVCVCVLSVSQRPTLRVRVVVSSLLNTVHVTWHRLAGVSLQWCKDRTTRRMILRVCTFRFMQRKWDGIVRLQSSCIWGQRSEGLPDPAQSSSVPFSMYFIHSPPLHTPSLFHWCIMGTTLHLNESLTRTTSSACHFFSDVFQPVWRIIFFSISAL